MVNAADIRSRVGVLLLAALVLTAAARLRGAEYDEQYTLFLTAGTPRPAWPADVFSAGSIPAVQAGHASLVGIVRDLRSTDVHPPLYFWAVWGWRTIFGPSLFAARLLSVLFGLATLWLVGVVARLCAIRPWVAMLLTLGCYGFVYTNAIARGFAPAEVLALCGVTLLLRRQAVLAGCCFGAACCSNYLVVFPIAAMIAATGAWAAVLAAIPFLALDGWFFIAQHAARSGQFPPFALWTSVLRLVSYQVAAVFGGLPLYFEGMLEVLVAGALGVISIVVVVACLRARPVRWVLVAGAVAMPVGLLLLGATFNNTPIELRYLSIGLPFVAMLAASSVRARLLAVILTIQFAGIAGLMFEPRTMQPAAAAARAAAQLAGDAIVLMPAGNDGVGIVGAFGIEAQPATQLLLIHPGDPIAARLAPYHRVALAALTQDRDSATSVAAARAVLVPPTWHLAAARANFEVYERSE